MTYAQRDHPSTSWEAAADPDVQDVAESDEARCYDLIASSVNGRTADEIAAIIGGATGRIIPPNQIASRLMTMRDRGEIIRSSETRMTRRGHKAHIHYVTLPPGVTEWFPPPKPFMVLDVTRPPTPEEAIALSMHIASGLLKPKEKK